MLAKYFWDMSAEISLKWIVTHAIDLQRAS